MLAWLRGREDPCPWDQHVTAAAASRDDATLQWLRSQQPPCPWDGSVCAAAAKKRETGKFSLVEPPCPWGKTCMVAAARQPNVEILQWLYDAGCPFSKDVQARVPRGGDSSGMP